MRTNIAAIFIGGPADGTESRIPCGKNGALPDSWTVTTCDRACGADPVVRTRQHRYERGKRLAITRYDEAHEFIYQPTKQEAPRE